MALEADVVAYLAAIGALGLTAGTNLQEGPMSEWPDAAGPIVAVTHYTSEVSEAYVMGPSLTAPGYDVERAQVMTRGAVKATTQAMAAAVHAYLDNLGPVTLSGRTYFQVDSDGPPASLGQDENGRWSFVANYRFRKARS